MAGSDMRRATLHALRRRSEREQRLIRRPRGGPSELTSPQRGAWFLEQIQPKTAVNHVWACIGIRAPVELRHLETATNSLVNRHEVLRASVVGGALCVAPINSVCLDVHVEQLPDTHDAEAHVLERAEYLANVPFDLATAPLCRVVLFDLGTSRSILLVVAHHLVVDGWSLSVFLHRLPEAYHAARRGELTTSTADLDYGDYAYRESLIQGWPELTYWTTRLAGMPTLDLPVRSPRPGVQTFRGGKYHFELSTELSSALRRLGRKHGSSPFVTLLTTFGVLIHRFSHQSDFGVGFPTANRDADTAGMLGMFMNLLVARFDCQPGISFVELLAQVREVVKGAKANSRVPFEKVVAALQPARDLGRAPLFQALFDMFRLPLPGEHPALPMSVLRLDGGGAQYDIALYIDESAERLRCAFGYNGDVFDAETARLWADCWQTLIASIVTAPCAPIGELPLLSPSHRERLLEGNARDRRYEGVCLPELFERQIALGSERIAIQFGAELISYGELGKRARTLAARLQGCGVGPGALVGVCVERSPWLIAALLGVMMAGAAYVPLDPALPRRRLDVMVGRGGVRWILADERRDDFAEDVCQLVVCAGTDAEAMAHERTSVQPEDLAYVIFTSGSTGDPKGVELTHAGLANFVTSLKESAGLTADDSVLALTTVSFDIAVTELLLPLTIGAKVILLSRTTAADPAELCRAVDVHEPTFMQATPTTWRMLVQAGWKGCKSLTALCGGEAMDPSLARALLKLTGRLWNMYGPTETTVWSTMHRVTVEDSVIPIGSPIARTQVYLLDDAGDLVPEGTVGEIYIGGAGLARGYLEDRAQTEERFVLRPRVAPGARLYRTGDLARYRRDGLLEYVGRLDGQVKLRGHRVELGEIESALLAQPGVLEAAVRLDASREGLDAHWAGRPDFETSATTLADALREVLPTYMMPSRWQRWERLPTTSSGKVDRNALPPIAVVTRGRTEYDAPSTALELELCALYADVLHVDRVGVSDGFFELGGHSLLAARLCSRVEAALDLKVPLRAVFTHPSPRALAQHIELARDANSALPRAARIPRSRASDFPLSPSQADFWLHDTIQGRGAFNVAEAWSFDGPINAERLAAAVDRLVQRHDALRIRVELVGGRPRQRVRSVVTPDFAVVETTSWSPAEEQAFIRDCLSRPFLPSDECPFRLRLIRGANAETLVAAFSHVVVDGWSLALIADDLNRYYAGEEERTSDEPPEEPIRFVDWCEFRSTADRAEHLSFWRETLANAPSPVTPAGEETPPGPDGRGRRVTRRIEPGDVQALRELALRHGATPAAAYSAIAFLLLHRVTGARDIVVGTAIAGRHEAESHGLVGALMSVAPLRQCIDPRDDFLALLRATLQAQLAAAEHAGLPSSAILDAVEPQRQTVRDLFRVLVNYHELVKVRLGALEGHLLVVDREGSRLDLVIDVIAGEEDALVRVECDSELLSASQAEALADGFIRLARLAPAAATLRLESPTFDVRWPRRESSLSRRPVQIIGSFSLEPLRPFLGLWNERFGCGLDFAFSPHGQVFQQLLPDHVEPLPPCVLLLRPEDWLNARSSTSAVDVEAHVERCLNDLEYLLAARAAHNPVIVVLPEPHRNRDDSPIASDVLARARRGVRDIATATPGAELVELGELAAEYGVHEIWDPVQEAVAQIPYREGYYAVVAAAVARRLRAFCKPPHKVAIIDCDDTLWGGLCGEVDPADLLLDHAHRSLQSFLVHLQRQGMLLALASKNNPADVHAVFAARPDMPLKPEHIVTERIGWGHKSESVRDIARELNLALESFVFIDDSIAECAAMLSALPEVLTLHLPAAPHLVEPFLRRVWAFDRFEVTDEDTRRTELYREESRRQRIRAAAPSHELFLEGLALEVAVYPLTSTDAERVAQLCARTTQFNLSPKRYAAEELLRLAERALVRVVSVRDRFGDYGTTGLLIYRCEAAAAEVDTFLLSCRVLGRGVEDAVISHLRSECEDAGIEKIRFSGTTTARNQPLREFLSKLSGEHLDAPATFRVTVDLNQLPTVRPSVTLRREAFEHADPLRLQARTGLPNGTRTLEHRKEPVPHSLLSREMMQILDDQTVTSPHYLPLRHASGQALVELTAARVRLPSGDLVKAGTDVERELVEIWQRVLCVKPVGVRQDFRDLGGTSVKAMQLLSAVYDAFGVELSVAHVFGECRIVDLAMVIESARALKPKHVLASVPRTGGRYPLSHSQARMWVGHHERDWDGMLNISVTLTVECDGGLEFTALERALCSIVRRHESLRARFGVENGEAFQEVDESAAAWFEATDLSDHPDALARVEELRRRELTFPFDLGKAPLIRVCCSRVRSGCDVVVLTVHHIVADGWSMGILLGDLLETYARESGGGGGELPGPLRVQYLDFAQHQRELLLENGRHAHHWARQFDTLPRPLSLPVDFPTPTSRSSRGRRVRVRFDGCSVRAFCERERISETPCLLAFFALLLHRCANANDIVIGVPTSGRFHPELANQVGCYVNTLPIRVRLQPNEVTGDVVHAVVRTWNQAIEHQAYPLDLLIAALGCPRIPGKNPLFDVGLVVQNVQRGNVLSAWVREKLGGSVQELAPPEVTAHVDLMLVFDELDPTSLALDYRPDLFRESTVLAMADDLAAIAEQVMADASTKVENLRLTSVSQTRSRKVDWVDFDFGAA